MPLGFGNATAIAPKASTQALSVDAHMDIGQGWVTTASFNDSLEQLDQRDDLDETVATHQRFRFVRTENGALAIVLLHLERLSAK